MVDDPTSLPTSAQQVVVAINNLNSTMSTFNEGIIPASRLPGLTGDVTAAAGSIATTIANDAVTTVKILDLNVTAAKLAADAVTTAKILDANVTAAKLAASVAGYGPAFSAYVGNAQNISTGSATKIQFNSEDYDTASCYDNATNYRFTPNVAGYYLVTGRINTVTASVTLLTAMIYKNNGSRIYGGSNNSVSTAFAGNVAAIVYLDGNTDYVELYGQPGGVTAAISTGTNNGYFQASLIRNA